MMVAAGISGGVTQLRAVGRDLRSAPRFMRSRLRRNLVVATAPITSEAKSAWQGGYGRLGGDLAAATRTSVRTAGRSVGVSVRTDGSKLPEDKQGLPPLVEGFYPWTHPLFGNKAHKYPQAPHPELGPAVKRHLPGVQVGVVLAVQETAEALAHGHGVGL